MVQTRSCTEETSGSAVVCGLRHMRSPQAVMHPHQPRLDRLGPLDGLGENPHQRRLRGRLQQLDGRKLRLQHAGMGGAGASSAPSRSRPAGPTSAREPETTPGRGGPQIRDRSICPQPPAAAATRTRRRRDAAAPGSGLRDREIPAPAPDSSTAAPSARHQLLADALFGHKPVPQTAGAVGALAFERPAQLCRGDPALLQHQQPQRTMPIALERARPSSSRLTAYSRCPVHSASSSSRLQRPERSDSPRPAASRSCSRDWHAGLQEPFARQTGFRRRRVRQQPRRNYCLRRSLSGQSEQRATPYRRGIVRSPGACAVPPLR